MAHYRALSAIAAAALLSATAGVAHAADKVRPGMDFTVRAEPTSALPNAGKTLKWDASKGRLGLTLDVRETNLRPTTGSDVKAGAYYRITPSLRVGGSVTLGPQERNFRAYRVLPADQQPKVRLETAFRF